MVLRDVLKAYVEERFSNNKEAGQLVVSVLYVRKVNRRMGKLWEESVVPEKLGIKRGQTLREMMQKLR